MAIRKTGNVNGMEYVDKEPARNPHPNYDFWRYKIICPGCGDINWIADGSICMSEKLCAPCIFKKRKDFRSLERWCKAHGKVYLLDELFYIVEKE